MRIPATFRKLRAKPVRTRMPGFDPIYYSYWYRDVVGYGSGPLEHYLRVGWKEGRDPSAGFSTDGYLRANPDVRASGENPLLHFLNHGLAEGRRGWLKDPLLPAPSPRLVLPDQPMKLLAPPSP